MFSTRCFFAEGRVKGCLRADFPFPLAFDHNLGTSTDEEQDLFGFPVHVAGDHAAHFSDVHPHRDILNPTLRGSQQKLGDAGRGLIFPLNVCGFDECKFFVPVLTSLLNLYDIAGGYCFGDKHG
jgi:hypothetical protein